jgi:lipoate-protein ligase A
MPEERAVRVATVTAPAVVLGSTQRLEVVDAGRAAVAGVDVVRRRGGGGAVLVGPGEIAWVDVFVPAGDELWSADVAVAFHWLGAAWTAALADVGVDATWHDGTQCTTTWSRLVCFAGLGAGEVSVDGRKVVGLSQRRSRAGLLFLCAALLRWTPAALVDLLALSDAERARAKEELAPVARGLDVADGALADAFVAKLRSL